MLNKNIEDGILRFVKYIRRMNKLSDEQLQLLLGIKINENPDHYTSIGIDIEGHIRFLRETSKLSDDQIKKQLRNQVSVNKDPVYEEIFEDAAKKKVIKDMSDAAKDLKSDGRLFAKKIGGQGDSELRNYIRKVA